MLDEVSCKVCRVCGKSKALEHFNRNPDYPDGRSTRCGRCAYEKYGKNYVKVYLCINRFDRSKPLAELFNQMIVGKVRELLDRLHESNRLTDDEFLELVGQLRREGIFNESRTTRRSEGPPTTGHSG